MTQEDNNNNINTEEEKTDDIASNTDDNINNSNDGGSPSDNGDDVNNDDSNKDTKDGKEDNKKEDKKDDKEDDKEDKIDLKEDEPVEYEDFEFPEGMEINQELLDSFVEKAKEFKLNQKQAQELIGTYTSSLEKQIKKMSSDYEDTRKKWVKELKDDKEFGGSKFENTQKVSENALNKLNKYNLVELLKESGLDNHPSVVKTFHLIGKNFIEESEMIKGELSKNEKRTVGGNPLLDFNM